MYNLTYYDFQAYMDFPLEGITVECYAGSNFTMTIVDTSVKVVFRIGSLTANEAMVHAINRMVHFSAFISQETNMCWNYRDLSYSEHLLLFYLQYDVTFVIMTLNFRLCTIP